MATKKILKFADLGYEAIRMAIQGELKTRYGNEGDGMYCWIREVFPGYAIYERDGKLWRVDYTISGTEISVGAESTEVMPEYVPAATATGMAALADQWLEIFRAGSYGDKGEYSADDVAQLAETYDAKKDEAPVVIGHPKLNAPAFGWVKEVKADGDLLLAKFGEVNPDFEAAVQAGSFKKRSIALFRGDDGKLRLRHVGFLGAMAPEVKGLADATFSGADFQVVEFNQEEEMNQAEVKQTFMQSLREVLHLGNGDTPVVFTEAQVTEKIAAATKPLQDKITAFEADQAKAAETTKTFSERAKAAIQKLKDAKRWLPAFDKLGGEQVFAAVAQIPTEITFGEGDKATKKSALDVLAEFVDGLGAIVPEGKTTETARTAPQGKLVRFNAPASEHTVVDPESAEMAEAAMAMAKEKKIEYSEALIQVRANARAATGQASASAV